LHPKETINAYLQLDRGQPYLFELDATKWRQVARYTNNQTQQTHLTAIAYDAETRMLSFNVPADLGLNAIHKLDIISQPLQTLENIDQNVNISNTALGEGDLADITQRSTTVDGNLESLQESNLYTHYFKTSQYTTFTEKMQSFTAINKGWLWPIQTGVHKVGINLKGDEYFDKFEINGGAQHDQLIYIEADQENYWVKDVFTSHVYKPYPLDGIELQWRDSEELGIVPLKAVQLSQYPDQDQLNSSDPSAGPFNTSADFTTIEYLLPVVGYYDLYDLQQSAATKIMQSPQPAPVLFEYLSRTFKPISSGHYDVKLQYVLPGTNKVTSSYKLKIQL